MKKRYRLIPKAIFTIFLLSLISCGNVLADKTQNESSKKSGICISIDGVHDASRTIKPETLEANDLTDFVLKGKNNGGAEKTLATWETYEEFIASNSVVMDTGIWSLTLTAKKSGAVYSGTQEDVTVTENYTTNVYFDLKFTSQPEDGKGAINLTLKYEVEESEDYAYKNATKAVVTLKEYKNESNVIKTETLTTAEGTLQNPLVINYTDITNGNYILTVDFYGNDTEGGNREMYLAPYEELVNVVTGHVSSANRDVYFDNVYKINFWNIDDDDVKWADGVTVPLVYSQKEGVKLPDLNSITKEGYFFLGWSSDYSSSATDVFISEIPCGASYQYIYANWSSVKPVAVENGIKVDLMLPENTDCFYVTRKDLETDEDCDIYYYDKNNGSQISGLYTFTDYFVQAGKKYTYFMSIYHDDYTCNSSTSGDPRKSATATTTQFPTVKSVPDGITADIMNDKLVYDTSKVEFEGFTDLQGYEKKVWITYKNENYSTASFNLLDPDFSNLMSYYNWDNQIIKPYGIQFSYNSTNSTGAVTAYALPVDKSFNDKFPTFRLSATDDHTIISVDETPKGAELTVFVPAGTKQVRLYENNCGSYNYFATIGDGKSAISDKDTTVKVLNKYNNPQNGSTIFYYTKYIDKDSLESSGNSTPWIGSAEDATFAEVPELKTALSATFDEDNENLKLAAMPEVDFGEEEPENGWNLEFEYYYNNYSDYKITASYTGGEPITKPVAFNKTSDEIHKECNSSYGTYVFSKEKAYIKLNAQDEISYYIYLDNSEWVNVEDQITFYKKYTVTFDADNGSENAVTTQRVKLGEKAEAPSTAPEKEGYIFGGWFKEDADNSFDFDTQIEEDISLKAKWLLNQKPEYTVTVTAVQDEMPMTYTVYEDKKEIYFDFPYLAKIYIDGSYTYDAWYDWTFEYADRPAGTYVIEFIESNGWSQLESDPSLYYSYTYYVTIQ